MKIIYYFKWLLAQYKFEPIHIFFVGMTLDLIGLILNLIGLTTSHIDRNEDGVFQIYKNEYWGELGDNFIAVGSSIIIVTVTTYFIVYPIRNSYRRFEQEQKSLFNKIDKGR
jgi:hypothetical protein